MRFHVRATMSSTCTHRPIFVRHYLLLIRCSEFRVIQNRNSLKQATIDRCANVSLTLSVAWRIVNRMDQFQLIRLKFVNNTHFIYRLTTLQFGSRTWPWPNDSFKATKTKKVTLDSTCLNYVMRVHGLCCSQMILATEMVEK